MYYLHHIIRCIVCDVSIKRPRERPRKRWIDLVEKNLKSPSKLKIRGKQFEIEIHGEM